MTDYNKLFNLHLEIFDNLTLQTIIAHDKENYYVIKGYNSFKCVFDKKTVVSIKTDYRVIDSNADKVRGNKYIIITKIIKAFMKLMMEF